MTAQAPRENPSADGSAPPQGPTLIHWLLWGALGAVVLGIVGFAIWVRATGGTPASVAETTTPPASDLPLLAEVPAFELIDRDGEALGRDDLLGRPWINDFIFTRCAAICPRMTQEMARVAEALGDGGAGEPVRFVSISVDPEHDTPEVLAAWAERFDAGSDWHFLTGDREAILNLAREGFLLGVEAAPTDGSAGPDPIVHSNRFALVDAEARIRGYYDPFDPEAMEKLLVDVRSLTRGAPNP